MVSVSRETVSEGTRPVQWSQGESHPPVFRLRLAPLRLDRSEMLRNNLRALKVF